MKKNLTKSKSKEDILSMLDYMIQMYGDSLSVPMLHVNQKDKRSLYTCSLTTCFLQALICRLPRSLENPEGIQRALVTKKVAEIESHLSAGNYGMPNAIVITLKCWDNRYLKVFQTGAITMLAVDLKSFREHLADCEEDEAGYLMEPEKELVGYMIDGHHRTEGAYVANQLDYEFPTSVYLDMDTRKMAEAFAGINCYQEKPSAIHTNAMRNLSGLMTPEENDAFSIMSDLNSNVGIFQERIKMYDGPREKNMPRAYVNASKMQLLLERWLQSNVADGFRYRTLSQQVNALQDYFEAWKACYPDAWDSAQYVLTKAMGIDILFDLYGPLCNFMRTEILQGSTPPAQRDFIEAIHRSFFLAKRQNGSIWYQPKSIALDELTNEVLPLTWESAAFGALSSGKGINLLKKRLRKEIGLSRAGV